jgi:hypothetical protein
MIPEREWGEAGVVEFGEIGISMAEEEGAAGVGEAEVSDGGDGICLVEVWAIGGGVGELEEFGGHGGIEGDEGGDAFDGRGIEAEFADDGGVVV